MDEGYDCDVGDVGGDVFEGDVVGDVGDFGDGEDLAGDDGFDLGGDMDTDFDVDTDSGDFADDEVGEDLNGDELSNEFQELKPEYFEDLKNRSEYPDTIVDSGNDWHRRDSAENAEMRDEFDDVKGDLINQWEEDNGVEWPTYDEDVYTDSGSKIRGAGNRYDAHHIQPLTYGGENISSNITPLHALEHFDKKGVHAPNSPFGRMG